MHIQDFKLSQLKQLGKLECLPIKNTPTFRVYIYIYIYIYIH